MIFILGTIEGTIRNYAVLATMEIRKKSTTTTRHDDGDALASRGENSERRRAHCHTLPVYKYISYYRLKSRGEKAEQHYFLLITFSFALENG